MSSVQIGRAAALFDVPASTLRWWERNGVLGDIAQSTGRRRYTETDLRRLGVAYLCHVTGRMPLELTRRVTAGSGDGDWRAAVGEHLLELDRQLAELGAARDYLRHLLTCDSDDPTRCPRLRDSLSEHTPCPARPDGNLLDTARNT